MTDSFLPFWNRIGLAFSLFFRVLFDGRLAAALRDRARPAAEEAPPSAPGAPPAAPMLPARATEEGAVLLLSLLQTEGRFIDFVQQDLSGFPDAEVGAVARVVHDGCRRVLASHLRIEPIRAEAEGQPVALEPGFDPNRIKLTGKVGGGDRLSGVLRHRGWQAAEVHLPTLVDRSGALVLCPAEVEL